MNEECKYKLIEMFGKEKVDNAYNDLLEEFPKMDSEWFFRQIIRILS